MIHFFHVPYRPTARTRARQADVRRRILDQARAVVAGGGFAAVSVQAVAEHAGVATGTVYRYFPSKADLLAEVFRRASGREVEVMQTIAQGSGRPVERLVEAITRWARRAIAGRQLAYALIAEPVLPEIERERLTYRRAYAEVLGRLVREGQRAGELCVRDPDVAAAALVGAMGEALVGPLAPNDDTLAKRADALVDSLVHFCLHALGADPERSSWHPNSPSPS